jgi:hypothetical protein
MPLRAASNGNGTKILRGICAGQKGGWLRSCGVPSASQSPFSVSHEPSPRDASGRGCSGWALVGETAWAQRVSSCGCAGAQGAGVGVTAAGEATVMHEISGSQPIMWRPVAQILPVYAW